MERAQPRPEPVVSPHPRPCPRSRRGRRARSATATVAALAALSAVLGAPGVARATDATLRMAFSNIINGPLDSATSPYTGGHILVNNLRDIDDSRGVRVFYAVPGYVWLVSLQFGCGGIRTITGALQTIPGVILFPFDNDMEEIFSPVESSTPIVVDWYNPIADNEAWYVRWNPVATVLSVPIKFGLNYTRADY
jgi:hypothetical protein